MYVYLSMYERVHNRSSNNYFRCTEYYYNYRMLQLAYVCVYTHNNVYSSCWCVCVCANVFVYKYWLECNSDCSLNIIMDRAPNRMYNLRTLKPSVTSICSGPSVNVNNSNNNISRVRISARHSFFATILF